ncbi:TPA: hypothetical protein N0F65_006379 [Lagenidium giganteum]|uniref:cGMP-dependent protein kinase n=1 Tax=Lagenidium giganteum TaxID=4803 RepID=A0AAV2YXD6_9STRA|nr:TPA: hypothetical protein N0F65_006379 [Lagenidium giganteum]
MGAAASDSFSPRSNGGDQPVDDDVAVFSVIKAEYDQMAREELADEVVFERMKQICLSAYVLDPSQAKFGIGRMVNRRSSDSHRKKHGVIFSRGFDVNSEAGRMPHRPSDSKTLECAQMLKTALESVLFAGSSDEELDRVLLVMKRLVIDADEAVIRQGDPGDKFYVVQTGSLEVVVNNATVGFLRAGDHFGELALIYDAPRAATIKAATNAVLWTLDRDEFRNIQARSSSDSLVRRAAWLQQVEILASLSKRQLALLAGVLKAVTFGENEMIIRQGDVGDTFYIVEEGTVSCRIEGSDVMDVLHFGVLKGHEIASFGPGDYFGEMALLSDMPRNASVYAKEPVKCLSLGRQEFDGMLGPLTDVLDRNSRIRILKMLPPFATKSNEALEHIVSQLEIKAFHDGQCIFRKGDLATAFYIVKSGCVKLIRKTTDADGKSQTQELLLKSNDTFGSESFEQKGSYETTRISMSDRGVKKYSSLTLEEIQVDGVLGEGSFGKVVIVHTIINGEQEKPMALKIMAKSHIIESDQQIQVMREKGALVSIPAHPFIVELYATYQDANNLYMLMELVQGGELFTLLHNEEFIETVDEAAVRFYAANVVLGLQHLHRYDYAYRDLKPENLLITKEGYLKFSFIPERTHYCGTLEYLAPEFVLNTGHDLAVDYWALGILIYEMLVGYTPFGTGDGDTTQLFRNIAMVRTGANSVDFPFHLLENCPNACDLVRRLLQGDPAKRIGVGINGDQEIRQHPWFSKIEWEKLYSMQLEPPYIPPLKGQYDISLFEGEIGNRAKDKPFDGKGDEFFVDF